MEKPTLIYQFDDLLRCCNVLLNSNCEKEFLRYITCQEEYRLNFIEVINECKRLKTSLDKATKDISSLESKLSSARRWLDAERKTKKDVEKERDLLKDQLENIKKVLFVDGKTKLPEETKQSLSFLYQDPYARDQSIRLSAITELDSTSASNLSDISYSRSEDDLDEVTRRSRTFRRHRATVPDEKVATTVKRNATPVDNNRKKIRVDSRDHLVATTTVTVPHDGPVSAKSIIETFPPVDSLKIEKAHYATITPKVPVNTITKTSQQQQEHYTSCESSSSSNQQSAKADNSIYSTPKIESKTVPSGKYDRPKFTTPLAVDIVNDEEPKDNRTPYTFETALDRINARSHCFIPKNVYMPEICTPCEKRIIFGKRAFKCTQCNAFTHLECRDKVPLPCVPLGTPSKGGIVGYLHEYVPLVPPMIPALVIHCVNEIENRGMTEVGLYRVPGADKDVRTLKDKFLKGKGAPDLSAYDIHSVCGCLKDFLRSLQDSIIPRDQYSNFAEATTIEIRDDRTMLLFKAVSYLTQPNRDTLAFIILHLKRVAMSANCKMPIDSLAKVFALTVIGQPLTLDENALASTRISISIMQELLNLSADYWASFIVDSVDQLRMKNSVWRTPSTESIIRKTSRKLLKTPRG